MLLETSEDDLEGVFAEFQLIDTMAGQPRSSGSLLLTSQITPLNNEIIFQEDFVSSSLDFGLSYIGEYQSSE